MPFPLNIIPAVPVHEAEWRELWAQYCGGGLPAETTEATWRRILDEDSPIGCVVAMMDGLVVGFVTFVEHECTWETKSVCYVEDVFVSKLHRGSALGVGFALASHFLQRLQAGEWSRLYGITRAENKLAQRLYSRYAQGEPYMRYVLKGGS